MGVEAVPVPVRGFGGQTGYDAFESLLSWKRRIEIG